MSAINCRQCGASFVPAAEEQMCGIAFCPACGESAEVKVVQPNARGRDILRHAKLTWRDRAHATLEPLTEGTPGSQSHGKRQPQEETMPQQREPRIPVTLEESHWRAIGNILLLECQSRGGDWLRWGESINSIIESAVQLATSGVGIPPPIPNPGGPESETGKESGASHEISVGVGHGGPSCPRCGGPMYEAGTYEELGWQVYKCRVCRGTHIEVSGSGMIERGDDGFLED